MKTRIYFYVISLAMVLMLGCESAEVYTQATFIAQYISDKYGRFDNRSVVEKNHVGKIYYCAANGFLRQYPLVEFYEITDPTEIAAVEVFAKEALSKVGVEKVKLIFLKSKIFPAHPMVLV
jgi:hypothetical protein